MRDDEAQDLRSRLTKAEERVTDLEKGQAVMTSLVEQMIDRFKGARTAIYAMGGLVFGTAIVILVLKAAP